MTTQQCDITPLDDLTSKQQKQLKQALRQMARDGRGISDFAWMMTLKPYSTELLDAVNRRSDETKIAHLYVIDEAQGTVLVAIAASINPNDSEAQKRLELIVLEEAAA